MLVGPLPIRPVFTHNQFYVVASFLHNIWWLPFNFRFSFFSGFTLRSVSRDNFTFFDILERVLPSCCCFSSQNSSLTWLRLWSWLRYCDFPFSCTLSCNAKHGLKGKATYLHRWFLSGWNGTSWLQKMQHWYICFWNATSWDKSYRLCGMSIR